MIGAAGTTATDLLVRLAREDPPRAILHGAKRNILNGFAAALGGSTSRPVRILLAWAREAAEPGRSPIWGGTDLFAARTAALVNGTMIHALDHDDTYVPSITHPTGPVLPAALHTAETAGRDGAATLSAYAVGAEISLRLASAVFPSHFERGFHITSTAGAIGASVAAGRILALDGDAMRSAIAAAATLGGGLRETFGSDLKAIQVGNAARTGILAAELAAKGLTGPLDPIGGRLGWARATSDGVRTDALAEPARGWLLASTSHKPFACAAIAQPIVDGAIQLRNEHRIRSEDVTSVEVTVCPRSAEISRVPEGSRTFSLKASIPHCVAVALIDGQGGEAQFTVERSQDPVVGSLAGRVVLSADPSFATDQARIEIVLRDGARRGTFVSATLGSPDRPLTDAALEEKFREAADGALSSDDQRRAIDMVWHLDRLADVRTLGLALRRAS